MEPNPLLLTTSRFLRVMESPSGIYLVTFAQTQMRKSFEWMMYISSQTSHCQQCKSTVSIPMNLDLYILSTLLTNTLIIALFVYLAGGIP